MEKRGKFEGQMGPASEDIDPSTVPLDAARYHNYHYDSPEYSRSDSHRDHYARMGEGYGREGYGRIDYGRHEPHSRDGSHGRSGEPGYGRTDSYGRMDPYGMSKSGYERGRYEHYRSDRERERERYYDYYREREYDREYRSHRDPRELREMRDPRELRDDRDREYRDPRDYREPRDLYTHPPPSPRPRTRDPSPSAARRERSPSASTQLGSWPGDESRPSSPSKVRTTPAEQIQIQNDSSKAVPIGTQDADAHDNITPMSSTGDLSTLFTEDAAVTALSTTTVDKPSVSLAQVTPTPLRGSAQPTEHQELTTSLPPTDSAVSTSTSTLNGSSSASTPVSQHPSDYLYRSGGGHGEYSHSRYNSHSGGYHHSYYRHPSNYHYKSHYPYRGPSSRPYSSPNYPSPAVELPPNWAKATDSEGRVYYYNEITRATQWDPPKADPPAPASAVSVLDPIPQAPASHFSQPHTFLHQQHQQHQHQPIVTRAATPEPPKPVNIDGFTQEQLQEVIGRAYDKQKQKNLANGIGSAGASVHDVDSPSTRGGNMHSPSMTRIGKPLKAMNEKDLKAAISAYVVKNMAKYKTKLETSEAFKKHARRITHLIADKEMRSKTFKAGELSEITPTMKNKIRRFIKDYMTKLIKKQQKGERSSSSTTALVNGSKNTISHVIVLGADGAPVPPHGSILGSKDHSMSGFSSSALSGGNKKDSSAHVLKAAGADKKVLGYGDVDVDDDDDVKYGEGDDGDDDEGEMDGEDDDDDAGVAAVPSSSVELPL
ncbi:histone methyltransferase set2 [Entomortierella beljakovae]|nr:histone methyltransferase set2 [Entomortierella beljakovae]